MKTTIVNFLKTLSGSSSNLFNIKSKDFWTFQNFSGSPKFGAEKKIINAKQSTFT